MEGYLSYETINNQDIIKHENIENKEITYYIYEEPYLLKYNSKGDFVEGHECREWRAVIKIDPGVKLINSFKCKWSNLGNKDKVYSTIFKNNKDV